MLTQCRYCRNNKGCGKAARMRGHGNRGVFNVPDVDYAVFASLQQSCPLMYFSQSTATLIIIIILFSTAFSAVVAFVMLTSVKKERALSLNRYYKDKSVIRILVCSRWFKH